MSHDKPEDVAATVLRMGTIAPLQEAIEEFNRRAIAVELASSDEAQAQLASELWTFTHAVLMPAITTQRRASVRRLRANYTLAAIGEMLGVNDSRVAQIVRGPD